MADSRLEVGVSYGKDICTRCISVTFTDTNGTTTGMSMSFSDAELVAKQIKLILEHYDEE